MTEPSLQLRLDAMLDAVAILSPTSFRFAGGAPFDVAPAEQQDPHAQADALAAALAPVLYRFCYARVFLGEPLPETLPSIPDASFLVKASRANGSRSHWDPNWRVWALGTNGSVLVRKGETYVDARPGRFALPQAALRAAEIGDTVELIVSAESHDAQFGFVYMFGETVPGDYDDAELARFYFNIDPDGLPDLVGTLTARLNRYDVPFRLKFLADAGHYERVDCVVLYVTRRFLGVAQSVLATSLHAFAPHLRPGVPLFAKQLAPGVGAADNPGTTESFGQSRCNLTARGVVDAWRNGAQNIAARRACIAARFTELGLSLAQPHLAAGLADCYGLPAGWGC